MLPHAEDRQNSVAKLRNGVIHLLRTDDAHDIQEVLGGNSRLAQCRLEPETVTVGNADEKFGVPRSNSF